MAKTKHRVLVVGYGSIGKRHLRCLLASGRVEPAVCELRADLRRQAATEYELTSVFADLSEALSWKPDAAVVATPAHTHVQVARRLVEAGIHILIEKPLAVSSEGIERLVELVGQKQVVVAIAYVYRAHPALAAMREAIRSGRFGAPLQVVGVSGQDFSFYRPAYRESYYAHHDQGGGAIQDALTHTLNAAEWLVGPIDRVSADCAHQRLEGVAVEDTVHLMARHGSVVAAYVLNQYQAPNEYTLTVACERGTVRFELHENRWRWMAEPSSSWHDELAPKMERDDWFTCQENAFLDAIEGSALPLCTLSEGVQSMRVNLAALRSAHSGGGMVSIPCPDRQPPTGDKTNARVG